MSFLTPRRVVTAELLDEHDAPRDDVERSLRDLRTINYYAGGIRTYRRLLRRLVADPATATVLDLGAGSADLLDAIPAGRLRIALDFKIDHLLFRDRESKARPVVADAKRLPFRSSSVDVVTSAHFFHHFTPDENRGILGESLRVARIGVAVNDTRRHYAPLLIVWLLGRLGMVGRITRFDAIASVLRAYTISEARGLAEAVAASRKKIVRSFPFRFGLLLWK
ncbi:MAG TPA: methyltransferase domain-containing protein [Thermoanaerobaculia bacterium]|nr:methyltransferase domain-containing protein [Thermoanaerobaculia bacterium]